MTVTVPNVTLNNGIQMPVLGFGVFQIPDEETEKAVAQALEAGYRHIDTASAYRNEQAVGRAIRGSGIPREELFVTTKLWIQARPGEEVVKRAFATSLERLDMDHVDLYLIHQPYGDYYSAWRAMQELYAEGTSKAIGVSNFHSDRLVDLVVRNDIAPAVNQIEVNPFHARLSDQEVMRERGVQIQAWGPLAEGKNDIFSNPTLKAIGDAHGKSVAQVVLRWLTQREVVVIPKSVRPERMAENLDVFDFELTDEQVAQIATLDTGVSVAFDHRDPTWVAGLNAAADA